MPISDVVVVIPARGGSKRIARKNLQLLAGRPLLEYSIRFAQLECVGAAGVYVSTEDAEIAECARLLHCDVIERPSDLATDLSPTGDAVHHSLMWLEERGESPRAIVTVQPTSPLRPRDLFASALQEFDRSFDEVDSVVTVSPAPKKTGPIRDGLFRPAYEPGFRSQDLEESYAENGVLYISKADGVRASKDLFGARMLGLIMDDLYLLADVDTPGDLSRTEKLFAAWRSEFDYLRVAADE